MEKMKSEYEKIQQINEQLKLENSEKENEFNKIKNEKEELKENILELSKVQEENNRLKEEREEYKNTCQKLKEECNNLMNDLKEKEKELLNIEESTKDKTIKLGILTKENKEMKKKLDIAEDKIMRLTHDNKEAEILAIRANDEISRLNKIINSNQEIKFYDSGLESVDSEKTESVNNDSIIESPLIKAKTMVNVGVQCNIGKSRLHKSSSRIEDKYSGSDKWSRLATPKNKPPHTMLSSYQHSMRRQRSLSPISCPSPTPSNASSNSSLTERPPWRLWSLYSKEK